MPLIDDLGVGASQAALGRREALGKMAGLALGVAGAGTAFTTIRFLRPNVLFEPATRFPVGTPAEIPQGTLIVMPEQRVYVGHLLPGYFAMSAVCTHLGCVTRFVGPDEGIHCPCHGSHFSLTGSVLGGPAPRPLPRLHLELTGGELVVDTRQIVSGDTFLEV